MSTRRVRVSGVSQRWTREEDRAAALEDVVLAFAVLALAFAVLALVFAALAPALGDGAVSSPSRGDGDALAAAPSSPVASVPSTGSVIAAHGNTPHEPRWTESGPGRERGSSGLPTPETPLNASVLGANAGAQLARAG